MSDTHRGWAERKCKRDTREVASRNNVCIQGSGSGQTPVEIAFVRKHEKAKEDEQEKCHDEDCRTLHPLVRITESVDEDYQDTEIKQIAQQVSDREARHARARVPLVSESPPAVAAITEPPAAEAYGGHPPPPCHPPPWHQSIDGRPLQ